jgi:hypothetical protein
MSNHLQHFADVTDLTWFISYLTGLMGLIWVAHMAGTHVHLLHAA